MYEIFTIFAAMKKALRNFLFLALAVLYTMSTMGYGVHRCTEDGTASLILLFGETPCEWVHSHIDSDGNTYTHAHAPGEHHHHHCTGEECNGSCTGGHHECGDVECCGNCNCCTGEECCSGHSSNCCSTSVYTVSHDQNTTEDFQVFAPQPAVVDFLFQSYLEIAAFSDNSSACGIAPQFQNSLGQQGKMQSVICTFRV